MSLEVNQMSLIPICGGCLSSDRKLTLLTRGDTKEVFFELLNSFETRSSSLLLCWECIAYVRKLYNFRKQVRNAQDYLLQQTNHQTTLSKLKITKTQTLSVKSASEYIIRNTRKSQIETQNNNAESTILSINAIKYEINIENFNKFNSTDSFVDNNLDCHNVQVQSNSLNGISSNRNKSDSLDPDHQRPKLEVAEPLTFIKVEESDPEDFNDELQGFYEDDGYEQQEFKDEHLKDVLNLEDKSKTESKVSRQKTEAEDFNESDDEPLKKKETEKRSKRGRKKKDDGEKVDRRKNPGPKREKPAGVVNNARVRKKLQQLNVATGLLEMVVLTWEEVEEERQKALNSEVFTRHDYRCYDCALGFNHKFKLENHMKKHDPTSGSALCTVCRVRCRDAHALAAHRRRHRVRWSCCGCGGRWSRAAVAADHAARAHGAPPPHHACSHPHCTHRAPTLAKLRNHLKSHGERQKCELCGKTFRDRTSLRTHLFIHKGEKEYGCPRCGKRFLFKKAMEVHLVTHDAPAHLYCHQCDMNFKNRMSYYQHMKYNLKHIDPAKLKFACEVCDKKFVKAHRLEEHNLAVHLKCTPIQCTVAGCHFACSSRPVLRTHTRMVHRNGRAQRNHVCHTCGKAYTTKKTLEGHMRSHTGERPFKCSECPSTFGYEAALYNHNKLVHLKPKSGRGRIPLTASNPPAVPSTNTVAVLATGPLTGAATGAGSWSNIPEQSTDVAR